ncbi:RNA-dependent rna polymerase like protein, partial [Venturia nashicola]
MDIIVHNISDTVTQKHVRTSFVAPLREFGIDDFHCQRPRGKNFAFITVLNPSDGQRFLSLYGVPQNARRDVHATKAIICGGLRLRCQASRNKPSEFDVKALELEASKRAAKAVVIASSDDNQIRKFNITRAHCGNWDYDESSQLVFDSQYTHARGGTIIFGQREAVVLLGDIGTDQIRIEISYYSCDNIALDDHSTDPTLTFTLHYSPKFYLVKGEDVIEAGFRALTLGLNNSRLTKIEKERLLGFSTKHCEVAGACKVYRFPLAGSNMLPSVRKLLQSTAKMPSHMSLATPLRFPMVPFERAYRRLETQLTDTALNGKLPFSIRFQMDCLARNGYLPPSKVVELLPTVRDVLQDNDKDIVAHCLRSLARSLPIPGPDSCKLYTIASLEHELLELVDSYDGGAPDNPYELNRKHQHINLVHRVMITPTGVHLLGPDPEPTNRVLRQYSENTDDFIRVLICDEDGGSVRYDPRASQRRVYDQRFRAMLQRPIIIAGKEYDFLGFSHSALRSHSCWFMAPILMDGCAFYASLVLKSLGNFEMIRTPAKCAARIGQNFTDTNETIDIRPESFRFLPMITRNGYDFSDGVGTISKDLLMKVWKVYGTRRLLKPTALQIRFQGCKGMVSLDTRLAGEQLLLRQNMKKFDTEHTWKLEICGAAFKPLPMFLNRQLIKILEDLGVPSQVFFDLQDTATSKLRRMTEHPFNAGLLLRQSISQATQMTSLIWHLAEIGLDYHDDAFLYSIVEMAVVTELRDMKYRGRIPVKKGMTLYGIMDETGYLQEGQVFVITEQQAESSASAASRRHLGDEDAAPSGKQVLVQNNITITRSPVMHPGDVQIVHAVDVPPNSPLQNLRNVVVFSQHGARDLPSQLSGGDLDGDLYNVIYDRSLRPRQTYVAAQYPRLSPMELNRPVTANDMSDFFVTFMETDQLGMLCNVHMQLADQRD